MTSDPQQRPANANVDEEHLRVLSVCYFVYGGLAGAFSLIGLAMLFTGMVIGSHGLAWGAWGAWGGRPEEQAGAAVVGCIFAAVGSGLFLFLGVTALLRIMVGVALRRHRHYVFCLVAAGLTCLEIPFGAALGVATLIVLLRPSTEPLFSGSPRP